MKKAFLLISFVLFLSIIYGVIKVVNATGISIGEYKIYGSLSENQPTIKQEYETWCVHAVLQAAGAGLQGELATRYVNDYVHPPKIVNCMFLDYNSNRYYCVGRGAVLLEYLTYFAHSNNGRLVINTGLVKLFEQFTHTNGGHLPCIALLPGDSDWLHAVYLYNIILSEKSTETYVLGYMDPWVGAKRTRIAGRVENLIILQ